MLVKPFRGDQVAAGAVVLTTLVALLSFRFDDRWGAGVHLVYAAAAAAFLLVLALSPAPADGPSPRGYQSVLYLTSLAVLLIALTQLADVLGSDGGAGTYVWVAAALSAAAFFFATQRNSAACTLVGSAAAVAALVAVPYWLFDASRVTTARWILALCAAGLVFAAVGNRDRRRRHAVQLIDAAGAAVLVLALSFGFDVVFADDRADIAGGWELVILAAAFGSIAYASVDREPGPAGFGIANLAAFVVLTGEDGSLLGWPLALAAMAAFLLIVGLRPTSPAPPEPGGGMDDEPPPVTTIRVP